MKKIIFITVCVLLLAMSSCKDSLFEKMGEYQDGQPQDTTVVETEWKKTTLNVDGHKVVIYEYKYNGHWRTSEKWDGWQIRPAGHSHNCDCLIFD